MLTLQTNQRGFTLIELMIGIVIMGIVMMMGAPSYRAWIQNTKIRNVAESILNGLQIARSEAVRRNAQVQFVLTGTNSDWTVSCVAVTQGCPDTNPIQSRTSDEGSSAAITVTPTTVPLSPGKAMAIFNNFGGTVAATAPNVSITQLKMDISPAVLPAADSRELWLNLGAGGIARMCDPDTGLSASDPRKC